MSNPTRAHQSHLRFVFSLGDTEVRYTDSSIDVPGFTSVPGLKMQAIKNSGTLDSQPTRITMPSDNWLATLTTGVPHLSLTVKVQEVTLSPDGSVSVNTLLDGDALNVVRNKFGKVGMVEFAVMREQGLLTNKAGVACTHQCAAVPFSEWCGLDVANFETTGVVIFVSGRDISVSRIAVGAERWERGYVELDGIRIPIRTVVTISPLSFVLAAPAPASWLGLTLRLVPSCGRSIEGCRGFNNEGRFQGLGFSIPAHNPSYESGKG